MNNTWYQRPIIRGDPITSSIHYLSTTQLVRPDWFTEGIVSTVPTTLKTTRIIVQRIKLSGSSIYCGRFMFTGSGCEVIASLLWLFHVHRIRMLVYSWSTVVLAGLLWSFHVHRIRMKGCRRSDVVVMFTRTGYDVPAGLPWLIYDFTLHRSSSG